MSRAAVVAAALPRLARRRRRRRLFPAAVADVEETGKEHVIVIVCSPAASLNDTRAFSPLSMQRSYKAEKSAEETDGGGLEQAGSPTQVATPPLTTLAHVGEAREVDGAREGFRCWGLACPAGSPASPATPARGEAEWRGARRGDRPGLLHPPPPSRGGVVCKGAPFFNETIDCFLYQSRTPTPSYPASLYQLLTNQTRASLTTSCTNSILT
jgi:hypothetical protein